MTDNALTVDKTRRQWHVLSLMPESEGQKQSSDTTSHETTGSVDAQNASTSSSAMIDLWSAQERDIR